MAKGCKTKGIGCMTKRVGVCPREYVREVCPSWYVQESMSERYVQVGMSKAVSPGDRVYDQEGRVYV